MALDDFKIRWDTAPTDMTVTSLASLADGNIWQSGEINDGQPSHSILRISYELITNAAMVANEYIAFYVASGDEAASNEIWDGGIGTTVGQIVTAANIAAVLAALDPPFHQHPWLPNLSTTFKGHFDVYNFGPSWQVLIRPVGEALSAGTQRVRRRYGTLQKQAS